MAVAEDVRKKVMNLKIIHEKSKVYEFITLSLGVATMIPDEDNSPADIVEKADKALYEAKETGRNQSLSIPDI